MKRLSFNISLGGIVSALCIILMFCVGIFPFFVYCFPMICGLLISVVYFECGVKTSIVSFISVSLLSLIISPDKESALLFTVFFGYYPILKIYLDRQKSKFIRIIIKFIIFNAAVIAAYYILISIFGVVDMSEMGGDIGKYGTVMLLILGNFTFACYDRATKLLCYRYLTNWRKHLFGGRKR